jgi:5-(carboxyamino)imidazole ribonucleotide mutase
MPRGVPVATVAIGGAANAGLLAARILGTGDPQLVAALRDYRQELNAEAHAKDARLPRT